MAIVYEHLRNDTNEVFYVGIGVEEGRAYVKDGRNPYWKNIVNKVGYTVNIIYKDIEHQEAKKIEILLIEKYGRKDLGTGNLVNRTDGGEGSLGVIVSEETRHKIREGNKGKTRSEEARQNMSKARKGEKHHMFGKTQSEEARQKMSKAQKGEKNHRFGKTHLEEARQKISEANIGKTRSEEVKHKMSLAQRTKEGVKGYCFDKVKKKYISRIQVWKKQIRLGSFDTPEEASEAYQKARLIYFV